MLDKAGFREAKLGLSGPPNWAPNNSVRQGSQQGSSGAKNVPNHGSAILK